MDDSRIGEPAPAEPRTIVRRRHDGEVGHRPAGTGHEPRDDAAKSRHETSRRPRRRLVSLAAAAAYADVSTRTLRRYISHGRLTGYRVGPRLAKVDLDELDAMARPIPTARGPG